MLQKSNLLALSRFKTLTRLSAQNTDEYVKLHQLNGSTAQLNGSMAQLSGSMAQLSESTAQLNESLAQLTESKN